MTRDRTRRDWRGTLVALSVAALLALAAGRDAADTWIDATVLPPLHPATAVEMRAADGSLLSAYMVDDGRWRLAMSGPADPLYLRMLVAYEDRRFATHHGVDPRAMARALWQMLTNGHVVSGGSTLTMQVARLLEKGSTGRWSGKLRQTRVALALERTLSKDQILDLYLTLAPMGGNIEGLRAATLAWFGKEPTRLTPAEAALLVALPQSPEARRPDRAPLVAQAARDRVLTRMAQDGVISTDTARAAKTDRIPTQRRRFPALAPHLTDRALAAHPDLARQTLTIEAPLQAALESLAATALEGRKSQLSLAILVADHRDGRILASVGSRGFSDTGQGFVDMTQALRSPGSTLKPLIYALAFDQGLAHPETLIDDRATDFNGYQPTNFDGTFRGPVRATDALQLSLNLPAVLLTEALGPANIMAALRRGGLDPHVPGGQAGLAIALGGLGLSLQDLVQLYAGLANDGHAHPLYWQAEAAVQQPLRITASASAWQVSHILSGLAPPAGAPLNRLAYKTGTSYGHRDAWAIGFDGAHVIGVWVGRPDGTPVPGVFGGDTAAPVLFEAFQRLKPTLTPLPPPPPETLLVEGSKLPLPLREFHRRSIGLSVERDAPELVFPPDGVALDAMPEGLPVRVRQGKPPFTWLVNGTPVVIGSRRSDAILSAMGLGFSEVTVVDANGRSDRANVRLQ
ncbi:penicillin-binding protein 1C [Pseudooceanicola sediminis]|uniref:peptidoglycan glycosyltransferase n=1 Tax=Pseudooceanicola sediminis TaxID=2211117 RepID=A0A399JC32_9RHOB|nr:penicillin-binding protein 1C [Pseudooceanicola sediminis]KAA2315603.1 penicillin-binding protein 1C [Puniceibacterium sp. HSS470]RII40196.1 penicillin-binding protein 1C [Pseudooceanicola sediminis]|tara:strand:- start:139846 stop:141906 length:2061 start_codon:yes stop_codon:yes gene_type:complete